MTRPRSVALGFLPAVLVAVGCGIKAPPLAPLRPVPATPTQLFARRVGDLVTLRLRVPAENADPSTTVSIGAVEIYARTLPFGSEVPTVAQLLQSEYLVGTIAVRPPPETEAVPALPPPPEPLAPEPPDPRPGPGDVVVWSETIPTLAPRPLALTREQRARAASQRPLWMPIPPMGLAVPIMRLRLPTRYYVTVGVSDRDQSGRPSQVLALPFGPAPELPGPLTLSWTESMLTVAWTTRDPGAPVTLVETNRTGDERPSAVQVAPISASSWTTPVTFGVERCFVVRRVIRRGSVSVESATVGPECKTPEDTFGPPTPTGLEAVSGPDGVTLLWDAVTAPDLAGYLVLRAEGASETLLQLTPEPITSLQWPDPTVRTGVRYVYFVVAVDATGNRGTQSEGFTIERFTSAGK